MTRRPSFGRRSPAIPPTPTRASASLRRCSSCGRARKAGRSMRPAALALAATCKMSDLPHLLELRSPAFDPARPYLTPPDAAAQRWGERLATLPGPRVGLCWGGNPRPDIADANRIDARRSIALERLA